MGLTDAVAATALGPEFRVVLHPGALTPDGYREAVATAVDRILAGGVEKVVLARDLVGRLPDGGDVRRVLVDLALGYPDTWTFAVDGLLGSSPETLVRVSSGTVTARVLAGSAARGTDGATDAAAALALATSTKDLDEHRFAVRERARRAPARTPAASPRASCRSRSSCRTSGTWPATSRARSSDGSTALDLAAALHPTAAVAGTPRDAALRLIAELEPVDRRRYGGPVGWVDADGNGKWAIALRAAEVADDGSIAAFAGAGIVAESDPDHELAETRLKFRPIVEAFGCS